VASCASGFGIQPHERDAHRPEKFGQIPSQLTGASFLYKQKGPLIAETAAQSRGLPRWPELAIALISFHATFEPSPDPPRIYSMMI
jgi:hypothetical protein